MLRFSYIQTSVWMFNIKDTVYEVVYTCAIAHVFENKTSSIAKYLWKTWEKKKQQYNFQKFHCTFNILRFSKQSYVGVYILQGVLKCEGNLKIIIVNDDYISVN